MDGENSKKIATSIFIVVLLLVGVLVGTLVTRNLSNSQNTKTQASQSEVTPLEVINPAPGQPVLKPVEVKARFATEAPLNQLSAVFKVGDNSGVPMKLELQGDKVVMTATLDPSLYSKGRNTLSIYLYKQSFSSNKTANGTVDLIGSSVFYIQI